jgi:hypothetical protein
LVRIIAADVTPFDVEGKWPIHRSPVKTIAQIEVAS